MRRGEYGIDSAGTRAGLPNEGPPVILVRRAPGQRIASATRFAATLIADRFTQPSVNVIGRIRGTDLASAYLKRSRIDIPQVQFFGT